MIAITNDATPLPPSLLLNNKPFFFCHNPHLQSPGTIIAYIFPVPGKREKTNKMK